MMQPSCGLSTRVAYALKRIYTQYLLYPDLAFNSVVYKDDPIRPRTHYTCTDALWMAWPKTSSATAISLLFTQINITIQIDTLIHISS